MEHAKIVEGIDLAALFAAGAASALDGMNVTEKQAEAFVTEVCKEAASGGIDDRDGDTFWSRNKGWLLPAIVGALAFKIGGDAGRYGRRDRSYISNAASDLWDRVKTLTGTSKGPLEKALSIEEA
jgi:hypothetical protein